MCEKLRSPSSYSPAKIHRRSARHIRSPPMPRPHQARAPCRVAHRPPDLRGDAASDGPGSRWDRRQPCQSYAFAIAQAGRHRLRQRPKCLSGRPWYRKHYGNRPDGSRKGGPPYPFGRRAACADCPNRPCPFQTGNVSGAVASNFCRSRRGFVRASDLVKDR